MTHASLLVMFFMLLTGCASGGGATPGMNRPALAWVVDERQAVTTLEAMAREGVPAVRIMLVPPFDRVARLVEHCNRLHIKVLLMVPLTLQLYYPPGTENREGNNNLYRVPPLSQLDVALFTARWKEVLDLFAAKSLRIHAFQIENEFNSSVFNGDLPVLDEGIVVSKGNYQQFAFWRRYVDGMNKLVAAANVVSETVHKTPRFAKSQIVLGGLARPASGWVRNVGAILVEPDLALTTLRTAGIDRHVDAYAIHLYPQVPEENWSKPHKELERYVEQRMQQVLEVAGNSKPWWITEWGFAMRKGKFEGCENGDQRLPLFKAFPAVISTSPWSHLISESYVYDWDESTRFRIWNQESVLCSSFRQIFPQ